MKLFINFKAVVGPTGGGNQFLKALMEEFKKLRVLTTDPGQADVILFNNYHDHELLYSNGILGKLIIHRVAGLARLQADPLDQRDNLTKAINKYFADGTIFQSNWARQAWQNDGLGRDIPCDTVLNAPDPFVFHTIGRSSYSKEKKMKLIAASWSSNRRKGFDVYSWLDNHLDFSRYDMTFVGNSPVRFGNIKQVSPVPSKELAALYREHDCFITAVRHEPCSNALIEAMHCGLPAVAMNDGGNPEIVGKAGLLFSRSEEIPALLENIAANYGSFTKAMALPEIADSAKRYIDFAERLAVGPRRVKDVRTGLLNLRIAAARSRAMERILYSKKRLLDLLSGRG